MAGLALSELLLSAQLLRGGLPVAERLAGRTTGLCLRTGRKGDASFEKRLAHMRAGTAHLTERRFPDGSMVEIRGNPMPGGGFVATFTDVTAFRRAELDLIRANETLEQRVDERTAALASASAAADRANLAKSRFLAAVSHDLAQPLNAARLFAYALGQKVFGSPQHEAVTQIEGALGSAETLLNGLLDISRLDAGGMQPQMRVFCVDEVLQNLAAEFRVLAHDKGLQLHCVGSRAWVRRRPETVRRILPNFLGNAVRYSTSGGLARLPAAGDNCVSRLGHRHRNRRRSRNIFEESAVRSKWPGSGMGRRCRAHRTPARTAITCLRSRAGYGVSRMWSARNPCR